MSSLGQVTGPIHRLHSPHTLVCSTVNECVITDFYAPICSLCTEEYTQCVLYIFFRVYNWYWCFTCIYVVHSSDIAREGAKQKVFQAPECAMEASLPHPFGAMGTKMKAFSSSTRKGEQCTKSNFRCSTIHKINVTGKETSQLGLLVSNGRKEHLRETHELQTHELIWNAISKGNWKIVLL